jgi:phosphatidylserine/phosphatidylglycerophosphate/cardiolipin synthase-like enzyme
MTDFTNSKSAAGLTVKLWRGERMVLIGMDVDNPEPDFVGFAIEEQGPDSDSFVPLRNRLSFSYGKRSPSTAVNGFRNFPSTDAPFQKFRWIQFPFDPKTGEYTYRVTKKHMRPDGSLVSGTSLTLDISLDIVVYDGFLDVGFTRNFASSQAYVDRYKNNPKVIPANPDDGLEFKKVPGDVYDWLGFEASQLIFDFLKDVAGDETLDLDFFAYDLNEPDIVALLEKVGSRLRTIIDDSAHHRAEDSAESQAADRLRASAGEANVKRMHFRNLQHNKVLIAKRNGEAVKVLFGSTNFSFRGLYIQANNALVFHSPAAAELFERVFDRAFQNPKAFASDPLAKQWYLAQVQGKPPVSFCFSPHADSGLSLGPLGAAVDQATSSVLFCIAFLNQAKSGAVREAVDRLMAKDVFSYGISDRAGGLQVTKPDGSAGIVSFAYLAKKAPEPFRSEWSGGQGIHEHHKFVVTDFNLPTAKVFTGSSNLAVSGEEKNGDNLVMIEDPKVATSYAIEALRVFDHLHFRSRMEDATAKGSTDSLTLQKPAAMSGMAAWFEKFYVPGSQAAHDRRLFSH